MSGGGGSERRGVGVLTDADDWLYRRTTIPGAPRVTRKRPARGPGVGNAWELVARIPSRSEARHPWTVLRSLLSEQRRPIAWARIDYPPGCVASKALSMLFGVLAERVRRIRWSASAPPGVVRVAWECGS
mgnify:CR=1 FL=1